MKASKNPTRWATLAEASALISLGWRVLSYGTGPNDTGVLLILGA